MGSVTRTAAAVGILAACTPVAEETSAHGLADLDALLDSLHDAHGFDEALARATAAGLAPIGSLDPAQDGRAIVLCDPAAPDEVVATLSTADQVETTAPTRWLKLSNSASARCRVPGNDTGVLVYPDGNIHAITAAFYGLRLDVCDPAHPWNCNALSLLFNEATAELGRVGPRSTVDVPELRDRIVVRAGAEGPFGPLARANVVTDKRGRNTCTLTINQDSAELMAALAAGTRGGQDYVVATLEHELGHCVGLHHTYGVEEGPVMARTAGFEFRPGYSETEKDLIRRIGRNELIGVVDCEIECAGNSHYEGATNGCVCDAGFHRPWALWCVPAPTGGAPLTPACACEAGRCVDEQGGPCGSCGSCGPVCECQQGRCVDPSTLSSCNTCGASCEPPPRICACEDGACVDRDTRAPCDECATRCTTVTDRFCGCSEGRCVDWQSGGSCDICTERCDGGGGGGGGGGGDGDGGCDDDCGWWCGDYWEYDEGAVCDDTECLCSDDYQ